MKKIYLFDWGNTIMREFPDEKGKMYEWSRVEAMPNAEIVLKELSSKADCYLATNAKDSEKDDIIKSLQRVNLHSYFKDIFCFKEIGFPKPSKEYFNSILEKLNCKKDDIVMIGDNLEKDVLGAENSGIDGILYDFNNQYKDYQGSSINDLKELLKLEKK